MREYQRVGNQYEPIAKDNICMEEKFVVDTTHLTTRGLSPEL